MLLGAERDHAVSDETGGGLEQAGGGLEQDGIALTDRAEGEERALTALLAIRSTEGRRSPAAPRGSGAVGDRLPSAGSRYPAKLTPVGPRDDVQQPPREGAEPAQLAHLTASSQVRRYLCLLGPRVNRNSQVRSDTVTQRCDSVTHVSLRAPS
jgi:hypothetical protein